MTDHRTDLFPYVDAPRNELFRSLIADDPIRTIPVEAEVERDWFLDAMAGLSDGFALLVLVGGLGGVLLLLTCASDWIVGR